LVANLSIPVDLNKVNFYKLAEKKPLKNSIEIKRNQYTAKEERKGFINIVITKSVKRRSQGRLAKMKLDAIEDVYDKPKRPARLLPLRMIL